VLVNNNLGGIALKQGRLDAALGYYQRAVRLLELIGGSLWVFGALHMNIANARIHRRELDQATEELTLAKENFEQAQLRELLPELYGLFAEVALLLKNLDEALAHGLLSLDLARELQMPREEGHNLRILGEIALAQHHYGRAEQYFKESSDILEGASDEYERAKVKLSLAELYAKEDKRIQAMTLIQESEEVFERLSAALDLSKARHLRHDIDKSASV
jgi:tetratricopeptide (TPR) repeat protein